MIHCSLQQPVSLMHYVVHRSTQKIVNLSVKQQAGAHWQRPQAPHRPSGARSASVAASVWNQALSRPGSSRSARSSRAFSSFSRPDSVPPHTKPLAWFLHHSG